MEAYRDISSARNLAPLPGDVDFTVGASLPMPGLAAWQGLFDHGYFRAGQSVLAQGAAGAVTHRQLSDHTASSFAGHSGV